MDSRVYHSIKSCRICQSPALTTILELGKQPPANSLRRDLSEKLPRVPLTLCFCRKCSTVQIRETVEPAFLFRNYFWVTGTSETAKKYSRLFFREASRRAPRGKLFCVEVASNDGTFLRPFQEAGHKVLGVDPAKNLARKANKDGIPTVPEFFGLKTARRIVLQNGQADFIFARNVIPHVAHVNDVIAGMKACLKVQGTGAIEFHYARIILDEWHYDSIYHEHLFYYSLKSLLYLLGRHGLSAFDVMKSPISGGSLVIYFSLKNRPVSKALRMMLTEEERAGVGKLRTWKDFSRHCRQHKKQLANLVRREAQGGSLVGYGASARSSTMLNFCRIDHNYLDCIADQNPYKHGQYSAGTDILILPPEKVLNNCPKTILLLAWNFKDEILQILKSRYHFKGNVILPLPGRPRVIRLGKGRS